MISLKITALSFLAVTLALVSQCDSYDLSRPTACNINLMCADTGTDEGNCGPNCRSFKNNVVKTGYEDSMTSLKFYKNTGLLQEIVSQNSSSSHFTLRCLSFKITAFSFLAVTLTVIYQFDMTSSTQLDFGKQTACDPGVSCTNPSDAESECGPNCRCVYDALDMGTIGTKRMHCSAA
ncbi:hypothetical protein MTO96_029733 [Rhipicephalus appendiculatus]